MAEEGRLMRVRAEAKGGAKCGVENQTAEGRLEAAENDIRVDQGACAYVRYGLACTRRAERETRARAARNMGIGVKTYGSRWPCLDYILQ